jgi:hypothetical protein
MKQITGEEYEVDFCISGDLKDLTECVEGVLTPDRVLLGVAYVVVGGEEDAEAASQVSAGRKARPVSSLGEVCHTWCSP